MSNQVVDRKSITPYQWNQGCFGWHLLADPKLSVIEEEVAPGAGEVLHIHHQAQQFFYVLSGVATIITASQDFHLKQGQGVAITPETPHQLKNNGTEVLRFLVISSPPTKNDRENICAGSN
ncbi:cupin domain-containing protein [Corallincola spongiicola]|uniref:cupin domain-containing protein n=1 Tax=Corallincola spongiicola TaxID=2520508 RepID=UPI001A924357|nr:cupin domain-containing protein [Corallincola spongiicola]